MKCLVRGAGVAFFAALAACATTKGTATPGGQYVVSSAKAAFYKYGPAQTFGPDFALTKGAKVTMIERTFGFCRVMTEDGTSGFVASEDLKPAPPEPPPPAVTTVRPLKPAMSSGKPRNSNLQPTPGEPLFDVNDVPMKLPDSSEPVKPPPKFRF